MDIILTIVGIFILFFDVANENVTTPTQWNIGRRSREINKQFEKERRQIHERFNAKH